MAIDLRSVETFPHFAKGTAATTQLEIKLPPDAATISVGSETEVMYIVQNGGGDGDALPTHFGFVAGNNLLPIKLPKGTGRPASIFIAAKVGTPTYHVILEGY